MRSDIEGDAVGWKRRRQHAAELAAVHAETARLQVETLRTELGDVHRAVARRDIELMRVLADVASANTELRMQLEHDQSNRASLSRAMDRLTMFIAAPPIPPAIPLPLPPPIPPADHGAGTIIGGSVHPTREPNDVVEDTPSPPDATIDLTAELIADLPVAPATRAERPLECEVHLQFGDRWITGFQIEETIRDGDVTQFRLRRQVDGWVLPELFDESEVRVFMQPVVEA